MKNLYLVGNPKFGWHIGQKHNPGWLACGMQQLMDQAVMPREFDQADVTCEACYEWWAVHDTHQQLVELNKREEALREELRHIESDIDDLTTHLNAHDHGVDSFMNLYKFVYDGSGIIENAVEVPTHSAAESEGE